MINLVPCSRVFMQWPQRGPFRPEFLLKNGCAWRRSGQVCRDTASDSLIKISWQPDHMRRGCNLPLRNLRRMQEQRSCAPPPELQEEHPCKISEKQPHTKAGIYLSRNQNAESFSFASWAKLISHSMKPNNTGQKNPCWGPIWEGLVIFSEDIFKSKSNFNFF